MNFMEKYGTHVILKCSYGYRRQEIETRVINNNNYLHKFKAGLHANIMDVVKVNIGGERSSSKETSRTSYIGDMESCGPPCSVDEAFRGSLLNDDWSRRVSRSGDSGVIYHDVAMPIADMLEGCSGWRDFTKFYRFWASERVRDLQQGWNQGLFSCSYMIEFMTAGMGKNKEAKHAAKACVHVDCVGMKCTNSYAIHQYPGENDKKRKSISFVTSVLSSNVETITIRSFDEETKLNKIIKSVQIFFREVCPKQKGIVKRFQLDNSLLKNIASPLVQLQFKHCDLKKMSKRDPGTLDELEKIYDADDKGEITGKETKKGDSKEKYKPKDDKITIAMARSIARGWTSKDEDEDLTKTN